MENISAYPGSAKGQNIAVIIVIVAVVGLVIWLVVKFGSEIFGIFDDFKKARDSVAENLGLKDSAQETADKAIIQKAKQEASLISSPWNAVYHKSAPAGTLFLYRADAAKKAQQIYDSVGVLFDNSDKAVSVFKSLASKAQVSWLCDIFNQDFGQDCFSFMQGHFDTEHQVANLRAIIDFVNSLPPFTK